MDSQETYLAENKLGGDALKSFQLDQLSISEKENPEFGKQIAQKIWGSVITGVGGYYYNRNARFRKNRDFANGRINVQQMFQDRFQFNAKQNYIRLVWNTLQIVNRIISGLVGRWMARNEKIVIKAIDSLSQKDKQEEYEQIEFIIQNRAQLEELQAQSGVQMIPQDQELPRDKEELDLWKLQFQRIPEEIETELGCNEVLASNSWFDVLKEKSLHDSAEVGLVGTYTEMDEQGVIHVEWVKPENTIYSWSEYQDFRDATWVGDAPSLKIKDLRRKYGKEFNPANKLALTEEQLFKIACTAKEYQNYTNLTWDGSWNTVWIRPYDEWNIRQFRFQIRTVDKEPYTVTKTKNDTTYTQSGTPVNINGNPKKPSENQELIDDSNINIYEGVYLPDNEILVKWGLKKNMIRHQDPKEIGNAEFSYSFYMYQNYEMRNLALPEKIEAAVDGMILALLKIQQIVARLVPSGYAINETPLRDIDYGTGNAGNEPVDHARLYFQTGLLYYNGTDAEGKPVAPPITELVNNGFVGQMQGMIADYQFWYQTLKDELGEDPNLITQALQPRVTAQNVDASQINAAYATDYMYRAYAECMKMTARKISCLIKDSIKYGSQAYRNIVKQDIGDRQFSTDIRFLPTVQEAAMFEAMMNQSVASNPNLIMFINPFRLTQMAKEDVKLAWLMFEQGQKKMKLWEIQTAAQNQQATIEGQIASAQAAEKAKQETEQVKGQMEIERSKQVSLGENKTAVVNMVSSLLSKGAPIDPTIQPLVTAVIQNIMLPLAIENETTRLEVMNAMQQAAMAQQQPQQAAPNQIQQPPPQAA